jgi:DNA primase
MRGSDLLILVEGYMDVIALHQAGIRNAVATCGTALTVEQARLLRRYASDVVTVFDGDEAGGRATARSFPIFVEAGIWARGLALPEGEDPDSFVSAKGPDALQVLVKTAIPLAEAYVKQTVGDAEPGSQAVARAGQDLAALLARVKDPFEHDLLVKKASLWTGISETVLRREAHRAERRQPARPSTPDTGRPVSGAVERPRAVGPEELLVTVLLSDPDLVSSVADRGVVDSMEEGLWKDVTNVIIEASRATGSVDASELMAGIPDAERARIASSLNADMLGERSQRERIFEDCIRGIDRTARRRHNQSVLEELRKTEQLGSAEASKEKLEQWRPRTSSDG